MKKLIILSVVGILLLGISSQEKTHCIAPDEGYAFCLVSLMPSMNAVATLGVACVCDGPQADELHGYITTCTFISTQQYCSPKTCSTSFTCCWTGNPPFPQ